MIKPEVPKHLDLWPLTEKQCVRLGPLLRFRGLRVVSSFSKKGIFSTECHTQSQWPILLQNEYFYFWYFADNKSVLLLN